MKKVLFFVIAALAVMGFAVPASAGTFVASDGVISIELPNDDWREVVDPAKWIALSDGANMITIEHYSNGEKLPEMAVADEHYVNVYQAVFSTQNEVFLITGSVVDAQKITEIANAIISAKVLRYDTKLAVKKADTATTSEFSISPLDKTMYVTTEGLNVRMGCSTDERIIGAFNYGASVKVTGAVMRNGAEYGWYQVAYEGGTGYVSANFLSDTAPAEKKEDTPESTGSVKTIYAEDGTPITVYQATDGYWYDKSGNAYNWVDDYTFSRVNGDGVFTLNRPVNSSEIYPDGDPFTVYWGNGNGETLTLYSDGYYYSSSWVRYSDGGDNAFYGADGTVLYGSLGGPQGPDYGENQDDSEESHKLYSRDNGESVIVYAGGGAFYDDAGTEYSWMDDGGMVDFYGNKYDVAW